MFNSQAMFESKMADSIMFEVFVIWKGMNIFLLRAPIIGRDRQIRKGHSYMARDIAAIGHIYNSFIPSNQANKSSKEAWFPYPFMPYIHKAKRSIHTPSLGLKLFPEICKMFSAHEKPFMFGINFEPLQQWRKQRWKEQFYVEGGIRKHQGRLAISDHLLTQAETFNYVCLAQVSLLARSTSLSNSLGALASLACSLSRRNFLEARSDVFAPSACCMFPESLLACCPRGADTMAITWSLKMWGLALGFDRRGSGSTLSYPNETVSRGKIKHKTTWCAKPWCDLSPLRRHTNGYIYRWFLPNRSSKRVASLAEA